MIDLYVVESPLQALSAAEARFASDKKYDAVIIIKKAGVEREVCNGHMWKVVWFGQWDQIKWLNLSEYRGLRHHLSLILFLIKLKRDYRFKVRHLYIGEFRTEWMHYLRCVINPVKTYLLDDGAATLTVQNQCLSQRIYWPDVPTRSYLKKALKRLLYSYIYDQKVARKPISIFTSFDLKPAPGQEIVKHSFELARSVQKNYQVIPEVYYFGSKYSEAGVMTLDDEIAFLEKMVQYYISKKLSVIYVPHRDDSDVKMKLISGALDMRIKELGCSAELYFSTSNYRPFRVASAYSSVLNNLRLFFGEECCDSFIIPDFMIRPNNIKNIKDVYLYYRRIGLNVVDVDALI